MKTAADKIQENGSEIVYYPSNENKIILRICLSKLILMLGICGMYFFSPVNRSANSHKLNSDTQWELSCEQTTSQGEFSPDNGIEFEF